MSCLRRCAAPCSRCMPRQGPEYGGEQAPSRDAWPLRRRALSLSTQTADDIRGGGGGCRGRCRGADRSKGWGGNAACAAAAHGECVGGSDPCESELSRGGLASLHETRTCKSEVARWPKQPGMARWRLAPPLRRGMGTTEPLHNRREVERRRGVSGASRSVRQMLCNRRRGAGQTVR